MKSEHRHELKTNDLAKSLLTFQDYVKVYGGRVFLGLAIVVLVIVLIIQRTGRSKDEALKVRDDLAYVIGQIDRLSRAQVMVDGRVSVRPAETDQVRRILQEIRDKTSDKRILADAMLAQGDYAWALAIYPDVPGAATQASLKPEKLPEELRKEAKEAYQQVISQYADYGQTVLKAHFGLSALAEQEKNWDEAKKQLEAAKSMPEAGPSVIDYANNQIKKLEDLRQPLLVGQVPDKEPAKPVTTLPSFIMPPDLKPATTNTATPATRSVTDILTPATTKSAATTRPAK